MSNAYSVSYPALQFRSDFSTDSSNIFPKMFFLLLSFIGCSEAARFRLVANSESRVASSAKKCPSPVVTPIMASKCTTLFYGSTSSFPLSLHALPALSWFEPPRTVRAIHGIFWWRGFEGDNSGLPACFDDFDSDSKPEGKFTIDQIQVLCQRPG